VQGAAAATQLARTRTRIAGHQIATACLGRAHVQDKQVARERIEAAPSCEGICLPDGGIDGDELFGGRRRAQLCGYRSRGRRLPNTGRARHYRCFFALTASVWTRVAPIEDGTFLAVINAQIVLGSTPRRYKAYDQVRGVFPSRGCQSANSRGSTAMAMKHPVPQMSQGIELASRLLDATNETDLPDKWRRRREFIERITPGNPHAGKLHVYTRAMRPVETCRRAGGPHLYVHSKTAVIDGELMLIGSANCNNRGWESDSELVVAAFNEARTGQFTTAPRLRMALWSEHLDQPAANFQDPVASRALWDRAPSRHVCKYVSTAGTDGVSGRLDGIVDPSDRRPTDPCCTQLRKCP
jgi:hypothetical protein